MKPVFVTLNPFLSAPPASGDVAKPAASQFRYALLCLGMLATTLGTTPSALAATSYSATKDNSNVTYRAVTTQPAANSATTNNPIYSSGATSNSATSGATVSNGIAPVVAAAAVIAATAANPAASPIIDPATDPLFNALDIGSTSLPGLPVPSVQVTDVDYITTKVIATTTNGGASLDVSLFDNFIEEVSPYARHYPPNFPTVTKKYFTTQKIKELEAWLRPYTENPNASYDVLLRGAKINAMARNLNLGSDYAVRASTYVAKAIERQPNSAEANFLYGMMLSEGGGFNESKKYLNKAIAQGYTEAEQSLAQADLLTDNRSEALSRLQRLQAQHPNDPVIRQQISIVQNGAYYIWDLPAK